MFEDDYLANVANILNHVEAGVYGAEKQETAYPVKMSHPVCPCCGSQLIIEDDSDDENLQLTDVCESCVNEKFIDGQMVIPYLEQGAKELIDAYLQVNEDPNELLYITDKQLVNALHRKVIEIQSTLKTAFDLDVPREILEQELRKEIKRVIAAVVAKAVV